VKSVINKYLLLFFPFTAVFGVPIKIGFIYLWPTELLIICFGAIYLLNIPMRRYKVYKNSYALYIVGFFVILFCNITGLIVGSEPERLTVANLRAVLRPAEIVLSIFVIITWIRSTVINKSINLLSLALAITVAGIAGLYGMYNSKFSNLLIDIYSPHLINSDLIGRFNMSVRAMSVFTGYDQASVTYSFNIIIIISLVMLFKHSKAIINVYIIALLIMFLSIVSSARTGIITTLAALPIYLIYAKTKYLTTKIKLISAIVAIIIFIPFFSNILFPESATIERFNDVLNISKVSSGLSIVERSEGVNSLYYTQVANVDYPVGLDILFGYGDNAKPISDSGYVTTYVKYGLAGMLSLVIIFSCWIIAALKKISAAKATNLESEVVIFNIILVCSTVIFIIAAIKGPLYFLSGINGDIMAYILAFAIYENTSSQPYLSGTGTLQ